MPVVPKTHLGFITRGERIAVMEVLPPARNSQIKAPTSSILVLAALCSRLISVLQTPIPIPETKPDHGFAKFFFSHRISNITLSAKSFRTAAIPTLAQHE
jgi:hypothetical protein